MEILALIVSFIAMVLIAASYFFPKKEWFLFFQGSGIVFLILSYLFVGEYFAMIGVGVALLRTLTFYAFEKKNREAPLGLCFLFAGLTAAAYFIVNLGIQKTAKPVDILYLLSLSTYAFVFRIRNLKALRFINLIPTVLSVLYAALSSATVFVVLSYAFELGANIVSIFKYHVFKEKKETRSVSKENTYAEN